MKKSLNMKNQSNKSFWGEIKSDRILKYLLPFFFVFGISLFFVPILFTKLSIWSFDYKETGEIGDIIGGTTSPFIAFVGVLFTFLAFWIQYKANLELRRDIEIERFENKYYELLKLHRANVEEMNIHHHYTGRKVFVAMYNELRFSFYFVKSIIETFPKGTNEIDYGFDIKDDEIILKIAYLLYFHGTGDKSDRLLIEPLRKLCSQFFIDALLQAVRDNQKDYRQNRNPQDWAKLKIIIGGNNIYEYETFYKPFDGHVSRLGHYYRHLYQTVKFIAEFDKIDLDDNDRYGYLKTLRAQLSSHEQVLLYYNSLSYFGGKWLDSEHPYLVKYKMIKNLPLPLADFGIKPEVKFSKEIEELRKKGEELFEWNEQSNQ